MILLDTDSYDILRDAVAGHARVSTSTRRGPAERLFRRYLRRIGAITPPTRMKQETTEVALLNAFRHWMIQNRGVTERTLDNYCPIIASLLESIEGDPNRLNPRNLRAFILHHTEHHGKGNLSGVTTALRTFLRYLIAEGKCAAGLDTAIPAVAVWRLSALPRYLPSSDVERVVAACDPSTATGSRNRAIVLLLARLGLRGDDIVRLRIGDIDWQKASIRLSGKGRREILLPLTQEVGDAILTYLERWRPTVDSDGIYQGHRTFASLFQQRVGIQSCRPSHQPGRHSHRLPWSSHAEAFRCHPDVTRRNITSGYQRHPPPSLHRDNCTLRQS